MVATKLRNVTITVEEDVARWARVRAAEENTSVSRLVGGLLRELMLEGEAYERARRSYEGRRPFLKIGSSRPTRDELHDRTRLR